MQNMRFHYILYLIFQSSTIEGLSSLSSLPETPVTPTETTPMLVTPNMTPESPNSQQKLAEAIDVIGSAPGTPNVSFTKHLNCHAYVSKTNMG